jgi:hypothetical protein
MSPDLPLPELSPIPRVIERARRAAGGPPADVHVHEPTRSLLRRECASGICSLGLPSPRRSVKRAGSAGGAIFGLRLRLVRRPDGELSAADLEPRSCNKPPGLPDFGVNQRAERCDRRAMEPSGRQGDLEALKAPRWSQVARSGVTILVG